MYQGMPIDEQFTNQLKLPDIKKEAGKTWRKQVEKQLIQVGK